MIQTLLKRLPLFLTVFIGQIVADQWTKQLATAYLKGQPAKTWLGDSIRLQYATNEGAFLSLGAQLPPQARYWVLTIGVGLLLLGLSYYALTNVKVDQLQVGSYALIASGGFSNWVDRARFEGSVVDFMNLGVGNSPYLRTGVFNVADIAILVGIGILFVQSYREEKKKKAAEAAAKAGGQQAPQS
ncbi:MAG: signal peptidase II [Archangium sp.]|nr:signal peptidase II [Archangium sp.]